MASIGMLGFIKGASRTGLDMIERREEEERENRKAEKLAELQREQLKYRLNFEETAATDRTEFNPTTGKNTQYNKRNEVLRESEASDMDKASYEAGQAEARRKSEMDEVNLNYKKAQTSSIGIRDGLDAQRTRSQISRNAAAEANYRKGGSSKRGLDSPAKPATDAERAKELVYQYKDVVNEAVASGNISRGAVQEAAIKIIAGFRTGDEARQPFLQFLSAYKSGRKKTDQSTRANSN